MPTRNEEVYFSELPKVDIGRSIFDRNFSHKTSFNVGDLIPFYIDEVIPGSTHNITTSVVARLQTLLNPIMDNMYLDTFYFFVPMRLLMDKWKEFCGENSEGPWTRDKVTYRIPVLNYPAPTETKLTGGFDVGSIADYFGVPVNVYLDPSTYDDRNFPSALPFRAYAKIVNEFFRDQNLQQPIVVHTDQTRRTGVLNNQLYQDGHLWYITDLELGGKPFKAARFHDYFSSCLPQPQRSEAVSIFGNVGSYNFPTDEYNSIYAPVVALSSPSVTLSNPIDLVNEVGVNPLRGYKVVSQSGSFNTTRGRISPASGDSPQPLNFTTSTVDGAIGFVPSNLWANLNIPEATITNLRLAFQLQKYFEKSARGGARYREYLAEFFGVNNGDARMQIPEYLGGHRIPLTIHQVANTGKAEGAALGDVGAMSNTSDTHEDFHMSFSEHGYIIGLCCVRYNNTFSQGLEKFWSRRDILDFYNPVFAHISEQPVFRREISLGLEWQPDGTITPDGVFGYLPAWQDYRQKPARVSGEMRPEVSNTLASWHLADDYEYAPSLSEEWIMTDENTVDRVLSVSHSNANQVFADFFVQNRVVQPMPLHSIPGLADHF